MIIDDFINPEKFVEIKKEMLAFIKSQKITSAITIFDKLDIDQNPNLKNTLEYMNDNEINDDFVKTHFPKHREFSEKLYKKNQIIVCVGDTEFKIHCDSPDKILSVVTYVYPEKSVGTVIYDTNKNYVKTVEWKQNRTLIFAPLDDITWHNYKSEDKNLRITFNTFLMKKKIK
jgi:hypothetical protein